MIFCKKFKRYKRHIRNRNRQKSKQIICRTRTPYKNIFSSTILLLSPTIPTLRNLWVWKKKLTLFSLIWLASLLSDRISIVPRRYVRHSEEEIHILKNKLQELPELNSIIGNQILKIKKMETLIDYQNQSEKKLEIQTEKSKSNLNKKIFESAETNARLRKEIGYFKKHIRVLNLGFEKDSEAARKINEQTQAKLDQELEKKIYEISKLNSFLNVKTKQLDNCETTLEITMREFELTKINLQEKIEELIQQKIDFEKYEEDLLQVRFELKQLETKLEYVENKGQLQLIFYGLEKVLKHKLFSR